MTTKKSKPQSAVSHNEERRSRLSELRIEKASKGPAAFARVYMPHLLVAQNDIYDHDPEENEEAKVIIAQGTSINESYFHTLLYDRFDTDKASKRREAFIAPRGFAKSTVVTILVLYLAAFKKREFIVWTSETASQVEELVASFIDEIEGNLALLEDFPHLAPAKDDRGQFVKFNDRDVVLVGGFRLSARGAQKATRGLRRGAKRPDLFICDDAEGEATTGKTQYPKVRRWLTRVIAPALAPGGDILWVCTLIDWTSVTGALIRGDEDWTRKWNVHHMQAEWYEDPEGKKVDPQSLTYITTGDPCEYEADDLVHKLLWEDYWPMERLQAFKDENGELAYSFEMLNKPMSEGDKVFRDPDWLRFVTFKDGRAYRETYTLDDWIREDLIRNVTFIDPSFGGKDYSAVVTVGVFGQDFFVREAKWFRGQGVRVDQVEEVVAQAKAWNSVVIGVEKVAAQVVVADQTVSKTSIPVEGVSPKSKSKVDRALPVAIRASQGHVYFDMSGPGVRALRELLLKFPGPDIDDPVDAFVYAVELAAKIKNRSLVVAG